MNILFRLSLCFFLFFSFCQAHAAGTEEVSPDMESILKRGKLIVAIMGSRDVYPFFMKTNQGVETGFDIDMARDIAGRLGVGIEFNRKAKTFDEVIEIVARKEADMGVSDLTATLERAKKVSFTRPYLTLNTYVLVNRKQIVRYRDMPTHSIFNRQGVMITVEEGTSYMNFVKKEFPLATIVPHRDSKKALQSVLNGKVFGLFEGEDVIKTLFREKSQIYLYLDYLKIDGLEDHIAIAVPWESVHLLSWLNLYLKTVKSGITIDEILNRYPRD